MRLPGAWHIVRGRQGRRTAYMMSPVGVVMQSNALVPDECGLGQGVDEEEAIAEFNVQVFQDGWT